MSNYSIDSLHLNGNNYFFSSPYATCSSAADATIKDISISDYQRSNGSIIHVYFANGNTATNVRLRINNETAIKYICSCRYDYQDVYIPKGALVTLVYDSDWVIIEGGSSKYEQHAWLKRGSPVYEYAMSDPETFGADVVLTSGYTKKYKYIYLSPHVDVNPNTGKFRVFDAIVYEIRSTLNASTYQLSFVDSDNNSLTRTDFLSEISTKFNNLEWTYIAAGDSVDSLDCVYTITSSQGVKDGHNAAVVDGSSFGENTIELDYSYTQRYTVNYVLVNTTNATTNEILYSDASNTYSDSTGLEFIHLGLMHEILPRSVRIKSGNYTGTGSEGTMELVCDFEPKYIHLMSPWTNSGVIRSIEYRSLLNEDGTINGIQLGYMDQDGTNEYSLTTRCSDWYPTLSKSDNLYTVGNLPNVNGKKYQYMILGGH